MVANQGPVGPVLAIAPHKLSCGIIVRNSFALVLSYLLSVKCSHGMLCIMMCHGLKFLCDKCLCMSCSVIYNVVRNVLYCIMSLPNYSEVMALNYPGPSIVFNPGM